MNTQTGASVTFRDTSTSERSQDAAYARALTDRIKVAVEATWELIKEAYTSRAWSALGYTTWDDYCTREFGTSRLRLPREDRAEVVASLRDAGLSTRAIESATGLGKGTIHRELSGAPDGAPDPVAITDASLADVEDDRPVGEALAQALWYARHGVGSPDGEVTPILGRDGKTYQPTARKPKANGKQWLPILSRIANALEGTCMAVTDLTDLDESVTNEEATRIRGSLSESIRQLNRINNLLKERTK